MGTAKLTVSPELKVDVWLSPISGDLRVRGWEHDEVRVDGERPGVQRDEGTGRVAATCQGDTKVSLPQRAAFTVQSVAGDARITDLEGAVALDNVSGDLVLRDVGPARVGNVSADFRVRRVGGPLEVHSVGSDATVREVSGDVHIHHVGADLFIGDVEGSCVVDHVGSDLVLNTPFYPERTYSFSAGSDVICRVPPDSNVRFVLPLHIPVEVRAEGAYHFRDEEHQIVTFGDGALTVTIEAGGQVRLLSPQDGGISIDLDLDFDFGIDERLAESMASIEERLAEQLANLDERLSTTLARQAEKVQKQAEKMRREAEKRVARMQKAAERHAKSRPPTWGFSWGKAPAPPGAPEAPTPPPEPVSDEERLIILRMLERGQITVEEAERLLAALEGRSK